MAVLNGLDEVALYFALVLATFYLSIDSWSTKEKGWQYWENKYIPIVAPKWLFFIMWPVIYVFEVVAVFRYAVNQSPFPGTHLDALCILYSINVILTRYWDPLIYKVSRPWLAGVLMIFVLASQIAILAICGLDEEWVSFGLFLVVFLWSIYLGIVTFWWISTSYSKKDEYNQCMMIGEKFHEDSNARPNHISENAKTRKWMGLSNNNEV